MNWLVVMAGMSLRVSMPLTSVRGKPLAATAMRASWNLSSGTVMAPLFWSSLASMPASFKVSMATFLSASLSTRLKGR